MNYRHGDVLIQKVNELPNDAKPIKSMTLAEGEATGHKHRIDVGELFRTEKGQLYLRVDELTKVSHEEHQTLTLPKGIYRVTQKRQYTPSGWEPVKD